MNPRRLAMVSAALVVGAALPAAALALRTAPRAREAGRREAAMRTEIADLRASVAPLLALRPESLATTAAAAQRGRAEARELAARLHRQEPRLVGDADSESDRLVETLAKRFQTSATSMRALLPPSDLPPQEAAFRLGTTRDLALAAADAGIRSLVFIRFPDPSGDDERERYSAWLPSRPVRMECLGPAEAHRSFLLGLMRRRERGPFYALDAVTLEPADRERSWVGEGAGPDADGTGAVRAQLSLRRVQPMPGAAR